MCGPGGWTWAFMWVVNICELIYMGCSQRKKNVWFWWLWQDTGVTVGFSGKQMLRCSWYKEFIGQTCMNDKSERNCIEQWEPTALTKFWPTRQGALEQRLSIRLSSLLSRNVLTLVLSSYSHSGWGCPGRVTKSKGGSWTYYGSRLLVNCTPCSEI